VVDELARKIGMDPIELRLKNAATEGYKRIYGETFGPIGFVETLERQRNARTTTRRARGQAARCRRLLVNRGGETTGTLNVPPTARSR